MRGAVFLQLTEGWVQTFSVTRKVIYSDTKLSACCVRELDDQYQMRKNKYRDGKQRWEGRRVAKVNWLTPFLAERHLSSTLRPFGVAIVFQLCTRRETKSHGRPTFLTKQKQAGDRQRSASDALLA